MNIMKVLRNEIHYCLYSLISVGYLILLIVTFLFIGSIRSYSSYGLMISCFSGPLGINSNLLIIFYWMAHQIYIFSLIGNYIGNELNERYIYIIIRNNSKVRWLLNNLLHILILILLYYLLLFIFVGIVGRFIAPTSDNNFLQELLNLTGYKSYPSWFIVLNVFIAIVLTTFSLSILLCTITILSKDNVLATFIIVFSSLLSIGIGSFDIRLNKFFLANQAIFSKHSIDNFNFKYSYIYSAIFIGILLYLSFFSIKKTEI